MSHWGFPKLSSYLKGLLIITVVLSRYWSHRIPPLSSIFILPPFLKGDVLSLENKYEKKKLSLNHVWVFATPWTVAHQAPLFRQEYWSGLLFPFPGDLPDPGIKPSSPALQADSLLSEPQGKPIGKGKSTPQLAQSSRRNAGHRRARQASGFFLSPFPMDSS